MSLKNVAGINFRHCQVRKNHRDYYPGKNPAEGSTLLLITKGRARFNFTSGHLLAVKLIGISFFRYV